MWNVKRHWTALAWTPRQRRQKLRNASTTCTHRSLPLTLEKSTPQRDVQFSMRILNVLGLCAHLAHTDAMRDWHQFQPQWICLSQHGTPFEMKQTARIANHMQGVKRRHTSTSLHDWLHFVSFMIQHHMRDISCPVASDNLKWTQHTLRCLTEVTRQNLLLHLAILIWICNRRSPRTHTAIESVPGPHFFNLCLWRSRIRWSHDAEGYAEYMVIN